MILTKSLLEVQKAISKDKYKKCKEKLKLYLMSNYSTQFIEQSMKLSALNNQIDLKIESSGYNQWEFSIINFDRIEKNYKPDFILLTLSSLLLILGKKDISSHNIYKYLSNLISSLEKKTKATIIFTDLEIFEEEAYFTIDKKNLKNLNKKLQKNFKNKIHFLNYDHFIKYIGFKNWTNKKYLITSKINFNPKYSFTIGNYFFKYINSLKNPPIRHIILDLDNTLWGGVVGDLGHKNVDLNFEQNGLSYLNFQQFILSLKKKGVILSICSKNTENVALEVFKKRKDMILKIQDFSSIKINWKPKSENISEIFRELNITETGTCFIDDSKFEREEVRKRFKKIYIPEMPQETSDWVNYLEFSNKFIYTNTYDRKIDRTNFYKKEEKRKQDKKNFSNINNFLKSLKLKINVKKISTNNERSLELLNKTNQFNFYTNRYNPIQFKNLILGKKYAYNFSLEDKYSDYGEIAVLIAEIDEKNKSSKITDWVMSCRAMSRSVENAIMDHYLKYLKKNKIKICYCDLKITNKNMPVNKLLEKFNFKLITKSKKLKKYTAEIEKIKTFNKFVSFN